MLVCTRQGLWERYKIDVGDDNGIVHRPAAAAAAAGPANQPQNFTHVYIFKTQTKFGMWYYAVSKQI